MVEKESNIVRTLPNISVVTQIERLFLPASKCTLSIHARFQRLSSKCLKYDLNPSNEAELKSRPSMFERAQARMQAAPYLRAASGPMGHARLELNPQLEAAMGRDVRLRLQDPKKRVLPDWKQKYAPYLNSKTKYAAKDPKTKEELDEELEKYTKIRAEIVALRNAKKPIPQDLLDEINQAMNGVQTIEISYNSATCSKKATSVSVAKSLKAKILSLSSSQLTGECWDHFQNDTVDSSKKELDDDLENYMRIARERREAKAKRMSNSYLSSDNLTTSGLFREGLDMFGDVEMDEY